MSPNAFAPRAVAVTCACALVAVVAPPAQAQPVHQVAPGESLWQIAARNGLSPAALAAANGLGPDAAVQAGQVVRIPPGGGSGAQAASSAAGGTGTDASSGAGSSRGTGGSIGSASSAGAVGSSGAGPSTGSVVVQPGDTLSDIAARAGVSLSSLAAHNGVTASALLPAGRALALPAAGTAGGGSTTGGSPGATAGTPGAGTHTSGPGFAGSSDAGAPGAAPASGSSSGASSTGPGAPASSEVPSAAGGSAGTGAPAGAPIGTRVSASDVGAAAAQNGVPASLARAIAWQESGFDNGAVSSAGARGVMQVMPETWTWIDGHLSSRSLDPSSAADNVHAGTLYLQHLLRETGGDADQAAAAYYQGLSSVRRRGMYDDTKRYVENVRALRARFGG